MNKKSRKLPIGNCMMVIALAMIILGSTLTTVKAAQGNHSCSFTFNSYEQMDDTPTRGKLKDGDSAYMQCTYSETSGATYKARFCFWNSNDGTQKTAYKVLGEGMQAWFPNGGLQDDTTWFEALLDDSGYSEGEDGMFSGRWRPDSGL